MTWRQQPGLPRRWRARAPCRDGWGSQRPSEEGSGGERGCGVSYQLSLRAIASIYSAQLMIFSAVLIYPPICNLLFCINLTKVERFSKNYKLELFRIIGVSKICEQEDEGLNHDDEVYC